MVYSRANPPILQMQPIDGARTWIYYSNDPIGVVRRVGYFSNALELGMELHDTVQIHDYLTGVTVLCSIVSIDSAGANLSDGMVINNDPPEGNDWILASGYWSNIGFWRNDAIWMGIGGIPPDPPADEAWILFTGRWNNAGRWKADSAWRSV